MSRSSPWCRSASSRSSSRVRRCSGPKPFACRVVRGRSPSPCRPGKNRSKLLLNPFSDVSVKPLPPAEAGDVVSGPKALTGSSGETRTSSVLRRASSLQFRSDPTHLEPKLQISLRVSLECLSSKFLGYTTPLIQVPRCHGENQPPRYLPPASRWETASVQGLLPPSSLPQLAAGRSQPDFRFCTPRSLCFPSSWSLSRLPSQLATDFGALLHSKIRCRSFEVSRTRTRSPLRIARRRPSSSAEALLGNEFLATTRPTNQPNRQTKLE